MSIRLGIYKIVRSIGEDASGMAVSDTTPHLDFVNHSRLILANAANTSAAAVHIRLPTSPQDSWAAIAIQVHALTDNEVWMLLPHAVPLSLIHI